MHSLRQHPCSHRAASCSAHRLVPPPPCLNARPLAPPATPLTAQSPCQGPEPHQPRSLTCDASKGFGSALDPKKAVGQTCPCGSKQFYRECCEQYHTGKASAPTAEAQLRARFCAFIKGKEDYIIKTYHPTCIPLMFPNNTSQDPIELADALKRYVRASCKERTYTTLRIHAVEPGANDDETYVEFSYRSTPKVADQRTGSRHTRVKAAPVEKNTDGTVKVTETRERSRFLRDSAGWRFADFKIITPPDATSTTSTAETTRAVRDAERYAYTASTAATAEGPSTPAEAVAQ